MAPAVAAVAALGTSVSILHRRIKMAQSDPVMPQGEFVERKLSKKERAGW
jgi:hypothetical protein